MVDRLSAYLNALLLLSDIETDFVVFVVEGLKYLKKYTMTPHERTQILQDVLCDIAERRDTRSASLLVLIHMTLADLVDVLLLNDAERLFAPDDTSLSRCLPLFCS